MFANRFLAGARQISRRFRSHLPRARSFPYHDTMKALIALVLLAGVSLALVGCETELPPGEVAAKKLERGLTGQGTVYQPDKSNDPIIREETRVGN